MLSGAAAGERLATAWHGGATTVEQLRAAMQALLQVERGRGGAVGSLGGGGGGGGVVVMLKGGGHMTSCFRCFPAAAVTQNARVPPPAGLAWSSQTNHGLPLLSYFPSLPSPGVLCERGRLRGAALPPRPVVPHYNHEAVARALRLAAEGGPEAAVPAVLRLLRHLAASGEVTRRRCGSGSTGCWMGSRI